jgi:hypothetical protein
MKRTAAVLATSFAVLLTALILGNPAFAADPKPQNAAVGNTPPAPNHAAHRYVIERTFPIDALAGLTKEAKRKVNERNASVGVRWLFSYANADKTKTYCIYEGPSEAAVRKAAELNQLPVDKVTEVPVTLTSR